ncbi:unnamed protein product [Protopolystoma xenopodis]|uniref:Uncharacterized protein n=1 Tax=Protopolystoma xenopodis TaxID=117903 RepID=A0A3S5CUJ0_9PLAT|nr:unnamed protein product [Protopolystoma xenopodis]
MSAHFYALRSRVHFVRFESFSLGPYVKDDNNRLRRKSKALRKVLLVRRPLRLGKDNTSCERHITSVVGCGETDRSPSLRQGSGQQKRCDAGPGGTKDRVNGRYSRAEKVTVGRSSLTTRLRSPGVRSTCWAVSRKYVVWLIDAYVKRQGRARRPRQRAGEKGTGNRFGRDQAMSVLSPSPPLSVCAGLRLPTSVNPLFSRTFDHLHLSSLKRPSIPSFIQRPIMHTHTNTHSPISSQTLNSLTHHLKGSLSLPPLQPASQPAGQPTNQPTN